MRGIQLETALIQIGLALTFITLVEASWLLGRTLARRWWLRRWAKLEELTPALLFDSVDTVTELLEPESRGLRSLLLRDLLVELSARLDGNQRERLRQLYRALGFLARDERALRRWWSRLSTARRLVSLAPDVLVAHEWEQRRPPYALRLMVLMSIDPKTRVSLVVSLLTQWPDIDRFQAHPVAIAVARLTELQLRALMAAQGSFVSPIVEALVFERSALLIPDSRRPWMSSAFASDSPCLREAACEVARASQRADDFHDLILAVHDPVPSVQAAAIRALAALKDDEAVPIIEGALESEHYLVRMAAAEAMLNLGAAAKDGLWFMRTHHPDIEVRRVAGMVLDTAA